MANATPNRAGQINLSGDEWALFLKTFGGEVLTAFEDENITQGLVMERNITHGKSAQFPATGKVGSGYHTPGTELTGRQVPHNEVVLTIDGMLLSDVFIAEIDELMNHYEVRSIYTQEMGRELARTYDENNLRSIILAARASAIVQDGNGGTTIEAASIDTDGTVLKNAIWQAAQTLDEKNAPDERHCGLRPAQYYLLAAQTDLLNRDWDGKGSYSKAVIPEVADVAIHKCNHIPNQDDTANAELKAKYQADYSLTRGIVWTPRAAGVVKLKDMAMEGEYDIRRQGYLMVSKYAVGHGPVRSDCAVELSLPTV